jgi:hypothetical protein
MTRPKSKPKATTRSSARKTSKAKSRPRSAPTSSRPSAGADTKHARIIAMLRTPAGDSRICAKVIFTGRSGVAHDSAVEHQAQNINPLRRGAAASYSASRQRSSLSYLYFSVPSGSLSSSSSAPPGSPTS